MTALRPARAPQRGNSLLLALIVMSSLATLGSLTVVSVQSSLKASTTDRAQTVASYAAESGAAAAMDHLRGSFSDATGWGAEVSAGGAPLLLAGLASNNKPPGDLASILSADMNASFTVELINNLSDPGYNSGSPATRDQDSIVIIRSTGHGPQGSLAVIEWEVQRVAPPGPPPALPAALPPPPPPPWGTPPYPPALHLRSWRTVL